MPASIPNRASFQVRIDKYLKAKLIAIGKLEKRNMNSQIEYFLWKAVEDYESEHGPVSTTDSMRNSEP